MDIARCCGRVIVGLSLAALLGPWAVGHAKSGSPEPHRQSTQNSPPLDASNGYRFVPGWPERPANTLWKEMAGIAIDYSTGFIWTLNRGKVPIQVYRPDGALIRMWGEGSFKSPHQLRFDKEGNVWVVDNSEQTVSKYTKDGK